MTSCQNVARGRLGRVAVLVLGFEWVVAPGKVWIGLIV
jgi:hypothetical protein